MAFVKGMVEFDDEPVRGIGLRRVDEIVVLKKRADIGVRQWIQVQRFLQFGREPVRRDAVAGEWRAQVLKIAGRDGLARIVSGVRRRGRGVVNRQEQTGLVHGLREVAGAFGSRRDGVQRGARDALAHAFVGDHDKGIVRIGDEVRNQDRAGHIEAELIAAENGFVPAVLGDLVRYGIQDIVAEILVDAPVPQHFRAALLGRGRTFGPHAFLPRQNLELLGGARQRVGRPRLHVGAARGNAEYGCQECMEDSIQGSRFMISEAARQTACS